MGDQNHATIMESTAVKPKLLGYYVNSICWYLILVPSLFWFNECVQTKLLRILKILNIAYNEIIFFIYLREILMSLQNRNKENSTGLNSKRQNHKYKTRQKVSKMFRLLILFTLVACVAAVAYICYFIYHILV